MQLLTSLKGDEIRVQAKDDSRENKAHCCYSGGKLKRDQSPTWESGNTTYSGELQRLWANVAFISQDFLLLRDFIQPVPAMKDPLGQNDRLVGTPRRSSS